MRRTDPEKINNVIKGSDLMVQDKGNGVTAIYDRDYNFKGIRGKDGSISTANLLSKEDREKYANFDKNKSFGVIDTKTGKFVHVGLDKDNNINPIYIENRIGKIKNKRMLKSLKNVLS